MYCVCIRKCLLLLLTSAAATLGGCYDSGFGQRKEANTGEPVTSTIHELRQKYQGTTFLVEGDVIVSGRVSTSDAGANFYRTFCIESEGAGLEIMAGTDHLHNDYPLGCFITLRMKGLALGESNGVLQVGRMPAAGSGYATDYLGSQAALDAAVCRNGEELAPVIPALKTLAELTPGICGTLVRIEGLRYAPEDFSTDTWAGYKRFTDADGAEIYTYVRSYAGFAEQRVAPEDPTMSCTLVGIVQYNAGNRLILKLRDEGDCVLF